MGLDLYHFRALDVVSEQSVSIEPASPEIVARCQFFKKKINQYIDFERLFSENNLSFHDYSMTNRIVTMKLGPLIEEYYFCRNENFDRYNTDLYFTNKRSLLPLRPRPDPYFNQHKRCRSFRVKAYPYRDQEDTVIYLQEVGYQRKDVLDTFFNEFPPDMTTADLEKVKRIHELTIPDAKDSYRRNFIDNWNDEESILVISW